MATITLTANTNYSALSVANGDTIDLAGFALTFDVNPAETGVIVQSPGTNGTIAIGSPSTYDFSGWSFTAGNVSLLSTLAAGKTVGGTWTGGAANTRAIVTNNGIINGSVRGGAGVNSYGVNTNAGIINGNVLAQNGQAAFGVSFNSGTINGNVTGGSVSGGSGVNNNLGLIIGDVIGGTGFNCTGVASNTGSIIGTITGGTGSIAHGVGSCWGIVDGAIVNGTATAIGTYPPVFFCRGDLLQTTIPSTVQRLYSFGAINPLATNNAIATTILSTSTGTAGFTGIRGVSRRLGT
jgi:hypothetical protein